MKASGQTAAGWCAFNALITAAENRRMTEIGYCLMLNASPTEASTVCTVLKHVQKMMDLDQQETATTFDLAIYRMHESQRDKMAPAR